MDENLIGLQGVLTTQGHIIELLLGAQLANSKRPVANVEELRTVLDHGFRFNMQASDTKSHEELIAIQDAAISHLHQILNRVRDQVSRPTGSREAHYCVAKISAHV